MDLQQLSGITLQQFEIFMTAAKYENFGKAAEELHMTTASVSRNISSLERQLNITLFTRHKQRIYLTEAGMQLAKGLPQVIKRFETVLRSAYNAQNNQHRALRIGDGNVLPSTAYLLPILEHFESKHPDIELDVSRTDPPALLSGLQEKKYDLIFAFSIAKETESAKGATFVPFTTFLPKILLSRSHPLHQKKSLNADDLRNQKVVVMSAGIYDGYWEEVQNVLRHLQIPISQVKTMSNPAAVTLELLRGKSISIMSELFAQVEKDRFVYMDIPDYSTSWELCLAYLPENHHPFQKDFINCARELFYK